MEDEAIEAVPDKDPLNVVAVMVFPNAEIPVLTYTEVPANPPLLLVPKIYNVEELSVVVFNTWAEVAVPDNVAVIVPAEKLPELSLKTIDDAVLVETAEE